MTETIAQAQESDFAPIVPTNRSNAAHLNQIKSELDFMVNCVWAELEALASAIVSTMLIATAFY